ncbi:MAG: hypothetical protein V4735_01915 [Pseudomonadota bacterium]
MAFSTQRGRPRKSPLPSPLDAGTPELRLKHALGITAEPIDICLEKQLISQEQHRSGLHLRWLYTLRYGAPSITTHYADKHSTSTVTAEDPNWRAMREREYTEAVGLLTREGRYECVMRLCIFNEPPVFLSQSLRSRAWQQAPLAHQLAQSHHHVRQGLEILTRHWQRARH